MRCHQESALLKLCSTLTYLYVFYPLIFTQLLFLSSVSQIIVFTPNFLPSSSHPFAKAPQVWGVQPVLKRRPGWESVCQQEPKGSIRKGALHTVLHPDPSSSCLFPGNPSLPSPHPSPASITQGCRFTLTSLPPETENYSIPKSSPLLSVPVQSLTKNSSFGSLLTSWMQML